MDLIRIFTEFATEEVCLKYLAKARWPEGVRCIRKNEDGTLCGSDKITEFSTKEGQRKAKPGQKEGRKIPARHLYQCQECGYQFTAKTETLFNDSHLPLTKWFLAITLINNAKKGLSAKQLERDLDVSYQTAWYVAHRVREAMESEGGVFGGAVEMDETYVGGRYDPRRHPDNYQKQAVMGVVQRTTEITPSQVRAFKVPNRTRETIAAAVRQHVANDATIYTDEWSGYRHLTKTHHHEIVIHSRGQYVQGDCHTNNCELFWGLFKRQIIGQHHFISVKHLQRYLDERTWAFNHRTMEDQFRAIVVRMAITAALPYAKLTAGPSASPRTKGKGGNGPAA
jgi:transposase-like protein